MNDCLNDCSQETWMPVRMFPPQNFEMLEVQLDDGSVHKALWTGAKWWCGSKAVEPIAWRLIEE